MPPDAAARNDIPGGIWLDPLMSHVISHGVSRDLMAIHAHIHAVIRRGSPRDAAGCVDDAVSLLYGSPIPDYPYLTFSLFF